MFKNLPEFYYIFKKQLLNSIKEIDYLKISNYHITQDNIKYFN